MAARLASALRRTSVATALYGALLVASLYPQSLRLWDTVAYIGDSLDTVYFMAWNAHQAFRDPLHLFDANILYPHREAMTLAGHRILPGILAAPLIAVTGNPILAYNVVLALAYLLAALSGRHLASILGIDPIGAWAAGALYAFNTYQVNEAPRADLLFHGFTALALGELIRFLKTGQSRRAWRAAGLMVLQGLGSTYLLLYGALVLALVAAGALVARPRGIAPRLAGLVLPAVSASILFLPVALPHLRSSRTYGFARDAPEGIDLKHYVSTLPTNLLYGEIGARVRPQQKGPHFVGFVSLALALLAVAAHRRRTDAGDAVVSGRTWVPAAAALFVLLVALSLGRDVVVWGKDLGPGPYRLLHLAAPGFQYIRIPERLGLLAMLFAALLVGQAVTFLRASGLGVAAVALAVVVPLEHLSPLPLTERIPVWRDVPAVYGWLAGDTARAVAEVPIHGEGLIRKETLEEYFSTYHFKPIIHGYVSYPPLLSVLLRRAAAEFPSESSVQALQRVGVDTVVVHHGRGGAPGLEEAVASAVAAGRLESVARFSGASAHVYEGTADEVVRLLPVPREEAAPLPAGRRLRDPAWRYSARAGDPHAAGDGDLSTAWTVPGELRGDEVLEVAFDRSLRLAAVVLPLRRDSAFPTVLRIEGLSPEGVGVWGRLARLDGPHVLQLVDQLLVHPGEASLGFDLAGREAAGVRLLMAEGARGFDGWVIPELEVRVP